MKKKNLSIVAVVALVLTFVSVSPTIAQGPDSDGNQPSEIARIG